MFLPDLVTVVFVLTPKTPPNNPRITKKYEDLRDNPIAVFRRIFFAVVKKPVKLKIDRRIRDILITQTSSSVEHDELYAKKKQQL